MTDNFNIQDSNWDLIYLYYLSYTDTFHEINNSLSLELSTPVNSAPTWYIDNT